MNSRAHRHAVIRRLLQEHEVHSQEELAGLLRREGITCTQATLSRDLRALHVVRRATPRGKVYQLDRQAAYQEALRKVVGMEIRDVRHNGTIIVIRTLAGRAEGVAGYLDQRGDDRILGTVAGDDTVFLAPASLDVVEELARDIRALAEELPPPNTSHQHPPARGEAARPGRASPAGGARRGRQEPTST